MTPSSSSKLDTTGYTFLLWMSSRYLTSSHCGMSTRSQCCSWGITEDKVHIFLSAAHIRYIRSALHSPFLTHLSMCQTRTAITCPRMDSHLSGNITVCKSASYRAQKGTNGIKNNVNIIQLKMLLELLSLTVPLCP